MLEVKGYGIPGLGLWSNASWVYGFRCLMSVHCLSFLRRSSEALLAREHFGLGGILDGKMGKKVISQKGTQRELLRRVYVRFRLWLLIAALLLAFERAWRY